MNRFVMVTVKQNTSPVLHNIRNYDLTPLACSPS